jgi:hypothetical protein
MKSLKTLLLIFFAAASVSLCAQTSPWSGFFSPRKSLVAPTENVQMKGILSPTLPPGYKFRFNFSVTGMGIRYTSNGWETNAFDRLASGVSYQYIIDNAGSPYAKYSFNALLTYLIAPGATIPTNTGVTVSAGFFNNYVSIGLNEDFNQFNPGKSGLDRWPTIVINGSIPF